VTGFLGGALLIAADVLTLIAIKVLTVSKASISGGSHHSYALVVLGAFALIMALGTLRGRSRPAMVALAVIGLIALAITLVIDLPDVHDTGTYGQRFEDATASPQLGFYAETLGAVLLLLAGGGLLLMAPRGVAGQRRRGRPARGVVEEGTGAPAAPLKATTEPDGAGEPASGDEPGHDGAVAAGEPAEMARAPAAPGVRGGGRPRAIAARAAAERLARRARDARRER
jgi:hypothetical protein